MNKQMLINVVIIVIALVGFVVTENIGMLKMMYSRFSSFSQIDMIGIPKMRISHFLFLMIE